MLTRYFSSNRKILFISFLTGLFTALLLGALQFYWSYHKRDVRFDTLITDLSVYMESYFDELKMSIDTLQPLTLNSCEEVSAALTSRAAFSINVRAFLLVRDKQAFCSSATGPMNTPMEKLIPQLHISKPVDIALLPGTPMLPDKPTIAIWYRNPLVKDGGVFTSVNLNLSPYLLYTSRQDEFAGISIVIGDSALSTQSGMLIQARDLPDVPARSATLKNIPLTVNVYAQAWTTDELLYAVFFRPGLRYRGGPVEFLYSYYPSQSGERDPHGHQARPVLRGLSTRRGCAVAQNDRAGSPDALEASGDGRNSTGCLY